MKFWENRSNLNIAIIKLLKYMHLKYFNNLKVIDEGGYWETEDATLLKEKIDFLNDKMDELADLHKNMVVDKDDTAESIADKIEKLLKEKLQKSFYRDK